MNGSEFDARFDYGEDVKALLDTRKVRRSGLQARRVNVDFPSSIAEVNHISKLLSI